MSKSRAPHRNGIIFLQFLLQKPLVATGLRGSEKRSPINDVLVRVSSGFIQEHCPYSDLEILLMHPI